MGASLKAAGGAGGRRRRGRRSAPMSEINVTPMVDVMLVLLIIFMVAAPMLTGGIPVDLPQAKGDQLQSSKEPLTVSLDAKGDIYIAEAKVGIDELAAKLKAIAKNGVEEQIIIKGDRAIAHGLVLKVMGRIREAGFRKVAFLTDSESGG
ncbi:MAG: biopolymer transporter ExbD [Hyphomicrobium sp.]